MKMIEEYLNTLYDGDESKEAKEIKEELKIHLTALVNDLLNEGYNLEEAQSKAIEQFDGDSDLSTELRSIYKPKTDARFERVRKLSSVRWKLINAIGIFSGAAFLSAARTIDSTVPSWLIILIIILITLLIILSIVISYFRKNIEKS